MRLHEFIHSNLNKIIKEWEEYARTINTKEDLNRDDLKDHIQQMLEAIAQDLSTSQNADEQKNKSHGKGESQGKESDRLDAVSGEHGEQRAGAGFAIEDMVSEYRALRASVLRLWGKTSDRPQQSDLDDMTRFNESIDQAIVSSVARYSSEKQQQVRLRDRMLSTVPDHACIFGLDGKILYANKAMADWFGMPVGEMTGKSLSDLDVPRAALIQQQIEHVVRSREPIRAELSTETGTQSPSHHEYILTAVVDDRGQVEAVSATARDITERKIKDDEIWHKANYDALTGLPNRRLFRDRLEHEVKHSERSGKQVALLFIDLDRFKEANDLLGHDAGDMLLRQAAHRICASVREMDTVARLGGDEFTVILSDIGQVQDAKLVADKILQELARPFHILHEMVHISGSIGITIYPRDAVSAENLVRNADQAMYVAKNAGRNAYRFYENDMHESLRLRLKLIADLRHALENGELVVYYQPIVDLKNDHIYKAEALLRWQHPELGLLLPGEFIPLAEETGLIHEIGNWVFSEAALHSKEWEKLLNRAFQVSVNKSPVQFMAHAGGMNWAAYIKQIGLPANSVSIEITEGVLLNSTGSAVEKITRLHEAGIALSLDDFGTGYSSMSYLNRFKVDYLKIDQSFISTLATDGNSRKIAETIIMMAHQLDIKAIAEGVETADQKDWLQQASCDYAQGFVFSKPVPPDQFTSLLTNCLH